MPSKAIMESDLNVRLAMIAMPLNCALHCNYQLSCCPAHHKVSSDASQVTDLPVTSFLCCSVMGLESRTPSSAGFM